MSFCSLVLIGKGGRLMKQVVNEVLHGKMRYISTIKLVLITPLQRRGTLVSMIELFPVCYRADKT